MGSFIIIIIIIISITSYSSLMFALDLSLFGFPLNCSNSDRLKRECVFLSFLRFEEATLLQSKFCYNYA